MVAIIKIVFVHNSAAADCSISVKLRARGSSHSQNFRNGTDNPRSRERIFCFPNAVWALASGAFCIVYIYTCYRNSGPAQAVSQSPILSYQPSIFPFLTLSHFVIIPFTAFDLYCFSHISIAFSVFTVSC